MMQVRDSSEEYASYYDGACHEAAQLQYGKQSGLSCALLFLGAITQQSLRYCGREFAHRAERRTILDQEERYWNHESREASKERRSPSRVHGHVHLSCKQLYGRISLVYTTLQSEGRTGNAAPNIDRITVLAANALAANIKYMSIM